MSIAAKSYRRLAVVALLALGAPALTTQLSAQGAPRERQSHTLTEKTSEAFQKLKPLIDAKNWDAIFALLDAIPGVNPTSYDMALILDTKAKIFLQKEQLGRAIEPQEAALKLSDAYGYFDENQTQQTILLLAQLIYAEAINIKDRVAQQKEINRSGAYLKRWLAAAKKPTPETTMFYAQILYSQATSDPAKLDLGLIKQARDVVQQGMRTSIQPKEGFYQLMLALLQQENDYVGSAELLELMVKKFPTKKDYWPPLMACYLQLANDKDETKSRDAYVRAINTIERAQALGIMNDAKNNYNLVTIYIAAGQFSKATDLLHSGLKKGTIESTLTNWRILGSYYQQANRDLDAISALEEASKLFPTEGMLDLQIGEIYRGMEKTREARDCYRRAIKKGNFEKGKEHVAHQLLAFAAMELDDWTEALSAITEASKSPEFQKDNQMKGLKQHIENTVAEREEAAKEAAAKEAAKKKI